MLAIDVRYIVILASLMMHIEINKHKTMQQNHRYSLKEILKCFFDEILNDIL